MTTRNRALRGDELREFEGRVRKWIMEWQPSGTSFTAKKLRFLKWKPTEERDKTSPGKRHPHLEPVTTPTGKPLPPAFMRPVGRGRAMGSAAGFPIDAPKIKLKLNIGGAKKDPTVNGTE